MTRLALKKPDRFDRPANRIDYTKLKLGKNPPEADAKFKAYARGLGCTVAGLVDRKTGEVHRCERIGGRVVLEFAHYRVAGKGLKGSDRGNGMCLCHQMHQWLPHAITSLNVMKLACQRRC